VGLEHHGLGDRGTEHLRALRCNGAEIDRAKRCDLAAAEQQYVADDLARAAHFLREAVQTRLRRVARSRFLHRYLEMTAEGREQIVEMVGDAAGERAKRLVLAQ